MKTNGLFSVVASIAALAAVAIAINGPVNPATSSPTDESGSHADKGDDRSDNSVELFDGKTLDPWTVTNFGGEGEVAVQDETVFLDYGADLTGIHREWPLEKENYEIELEAKKVEGGDFFVGLTFPIGDGFSSLILGGWGGGVCGLSSINGDDASENETTDYRAFETDKWYKVRVRVTSTQVVVWLDDKEYLVVNREDKKFDVRFELEMSKPFGLCSFMTQAQYRGLRARPLTKGEQSVTF